MSNTNKELFSATGRPTRYVDIKNRLETIKQAIFTADKRCQVVLIKGSGGLGKTRLLEEVLRRLGNKEMTERYTPLPESERWSTQGIFSTRLLDFINIRLHDRDTFVNQLANSRTWGYRRELRFPNYEMQNIEATRLKDAGTGYSLWQEKINQSLTAFEADYKNNITQQRLVWVLDTAEQLAMIHSRWLIDRGLLTDEDLQFSTHQ